MDNKSRFYDIANKLNLKIAFKNESLFMKTIGTILFFNKGFMNSFITTIGSTVYFPSRDFLDKSGIEMLEVLCHEKCHERDHELNKLFPLLYLFPQILAPFAFLLCFYSWWLGLILGALFLLPLPAYWRKTYELRGYKMSLFVTSELCKEYNLSKEQIISNLNKSCDFFDKMFTGSSYYFMWMFGVRKELDETVNKILSDDILKDDPIYAEMRDLLVSTRV